MEDKTQLSETNQLSKKLIIITFTGVILAIFLSALDQTIVGTAMPKIVADLGGFSHYTWVTTAYLLTSTITVPIIGRLTDIYGRKWFYISGLCIFLIGSVLSGFSQTMIQLIIFRGFQGIGGGIMIANAFTVIADLFAPAERGKYQGFITGIWGVSSIIGPTLGGFITDKLSWHWVFFINVPLAILVIILFIFFFPYFKRDNLKHSLDWPGITTLILTVAPTMLALSWGGSEYNWMSPQILGLFIFAIIMLFIFITIERRSPEPIIPLSLFSNRIVTISLSIVFLTGMCMFMGIIFVPLFFQGVLGLSATTSGSFLTPMLLGQVCGSLISGQLLSRAGGHYRIQGMIGLVIMATGMFLVARMTLDTTYSAAMINVVIMGLGLGLNMPLYTIAIQNIVPYNIVGAATSSVAFFRSIGGSFGLAILGTIMTNHYSAAFLAKIPALVKSTVPADTLRAMANNPEALISVDAQNQLKGILSPLGEQGTNALNQLIEVMRRSLSGALTQVFFLGFVLILIALILCFFLKEVPLRKKRNVRETTQNPKTANK